MIIDVESKPIVAAHTNEIRLVEEVGEIDTTWVVYGTEKRFEGGGIGIPSAELFRSGERIKASARS